MASNTDGVGAAGAHKNLAETPTVPSSKAEEKKPVTVEAVVDDGDIPDPDEDDLDDLDDMLNDFSAVNINQSAAAAASTTAAGPSSQQAPGAGAEEPVLSEEEFARQLQAGMAELLGELERSPEVQAQFESIFRELGAAASASAEEIAKNPPPGAAPVAGSSGSRPSTSSGPSPADAASFQETIRKTIERMQQSGEQATAAAAAEGADDFLTELLKQMQSGALDGEGGEEEFSKMLLGMMEQLTNKEILYEPMKELHEKFPEWIEKNRGKVSAEDLQRYEEQQTYVREIVAKFEEPTYSDENKADREYIIDRMQKMQATGQPPADLVGEMPSTQDILNMPDESCNPQ